MTTLKEIERKESGQMKGVKEGGRETERTNESKGDKVGGLMVFSNILSIRESITK